MMKIDNYRVNLQLPTKKCLLFLGLLFALYSFSFSVAVQAETDDDAAFDLCRVPHCAMLASSAFTQDGDLAVLWSTERQLFVSRSADAGKTFKPPVLVTYVEKGISNSEEGRPAIASAPNGDIYVLYRIKGMGRSGIVHFARSFDGAKTFSQPKILSHGSFHVLNVDDAGTITVGWLDKRDRTIIRDNGGEYEGQAMYFAQSKDGGHNFVEQKISDNTCNCCRNAVTNDGAGRAVLVWRQIYFEDVGLEGGSQIRDHAMATIEDGKLAGEVVRASVDNWRFEGCPHHGPSISVDKSGRYHLAWWTGAEQEPGMFYAYSDTRGQSFSERIHYGDPARSSHPYVMASGNKIYLVWKELGLDGQQTDIMAMMSEDSGATWGNPAPVAGTRGNSGHPFLIKDRQSSVYLSWLNQQAGYQLVKL